MEKNYEPLLERLMPWEYKHPHVPADEEQWGLASRHGYPSAFWYERDMWLIFPPY